MSHPPEPSVDRRATPRGPVREHPARNAEEVGHSTWFDGLLAESGHVTRPDGLSGPSGVPEEGPPPPAPSRPAARRPAQAPAAPPVRSAFDACHGGVVLRALLFVHGALAVGLAHGSLDWRDWLTDLGLAVAIALPATLAWLVAVCAAQNLWLKLPPAGQWLAMCGLGAACALLAWMPMVMLDLVALRGLGWLAPLATGAALAGAMFHWLQQRARLQLPATTVARLAELQSRIRPHFLFNALNSAVALVRIDPQRAEEVLEDLAELFRAALVRAGEQVTLGEEVELAKRYLAIEQVRFGARLKVDWQLDAQASAARVPSLMLQPLVENAVRYGVEPSTEGGEIHIRTRVHRGQALISITNSVPSGPPRPGHGMALRNVRERLMLLHDLTMRFEAGAIEGGRYRVRIAVPLQP